MVNSFALRLMLGIAKAWAAPAHFTSSLPHIRSGLGMITFGIGITLTPPGPDSGIIQFSISKGLAHQGYMGFPNHLLRGVRPEYTPYGFHNQARFRIMQGKHFAARKQIRR